MKHFFFQTRWAIRNDPALGFVLLLVLTYWMSWCHAQRSMMRQLKERTIVALYTLSHE